MEEILVKYADLSDPYFPKVQVGVFYVNYRPTQYASVYGSIRGFTWDGHPVILHGLRLDSDTNEIFARAVDFLNRPSIFTYNHHEPEPEPVQTSAPDFSPPPEPEIQYAWPDSYCWGVLDIDRRQLPENRDEANGVVDNKFREKTLQIHPDQGGDADKFRRVITARAEARRILSSLVRV